NALVLIERSREKGFLVFDGGVRDFRFIDKPLSGHAFSVEAVKKSTGSAPANARPWFEDILGRFRSTITTLLVITFAMNVLSLLVPVFVMGVYDKVVSAKSIITLISFLSGILIALAAEVYLRRLRVRALAFLGARFESLVSIGVVQKLLNFPITMTEAASVGTQATRLRQFEGIRDLFVGPLATAILDIPFVVLFCITVFLIGGPLGWVPVGFIALLSLMGLVTTPISRRRVAQTVDSNVENRNFLMEVTSHNDTLREVNAQAAWVERYRTIAVKHFTAQFRAQHFNNMVQMLAHGLTMLAGVVTLFIGTHMVLEQTLSMGALIAVMALVWRVLTPLQSAFMSLNRLGQAVSSIRQINLMMRMPQERDPGHLPTVFRKLSGRVTISNLAFRFNAQSDPVLRGVSLDIAPGELVAVTGGSGSGKSTLVKLIAGLYRQQGGKIAIDGLDVRQIDAGELRHRLGFADGRRDFFYGTILQNIQLAHPEATEQGATAALECVGAKAAVEALPEGIHTRLSGALMATLSEKFKQQLSLARALVKPVPIYLLIEPGRDLDDESDAAFIACLRRTKGKSTIIMVTQRPSHMRLADRVVVMQQGIIAAHGPPDKVLGEQKAPRRAE
ncbi:MAG: peptidase domain-containing ABC transporter, partial [Alphaproteobacteria bacterium]